MPFHICIADYLRFISNAKSLWFLLNTSYDHGRHLASRFWLSDCLSPSSCCVTLLSSRCAGWLSHHFSSSSCCAPHSSSHRADWLLLSRRPLVVSLSCRLVVSSSRRLVVSSSRRLVVSSSHCFVVLPSCHLILSSSHHLVISSSRHLVVLVVLSLRHHHIV